MKKRHLITLAIIATLSGCTPQVPSMDRDEDSRNTEPQDTTNVTVNTETEDWTTKIDTTIFITGTPTE